LRGWDTAGRGGAGLLKPLLYFAHFVKGGGGWGVFELSNCAVLP